MIQKLSLSIMLTIAAALGSYLKKIERENIPTVENLQIATMYATVESSISPTEYVDDIGSLTYPEKAEVIRQMIRDEFKDEETDPFVKKALELFGPKVILTCAKKGYKTPGERVAQLLLESSKVVNGQRQWSNLTLIHNNFGGVKALKNLRATPPLKTEEVLKGKRGTYKLRFAAFDNKWQGMDKYLKIVGNKRYAKAMKLNGKSHFIALAKAGYCTEPAESYAALCMTLFNKYELIKLNKILESWESSGSTSPQLAQSH